jgi:glycosyltransferase involved in cell wall biosynthesis
MSQNHSMKLFSTLILTLNEVKTLPHLIKRLRKVCDDIVVLDSYSNDGTQILARNLGCRVYQRTFDTEKEQRAYAISLPFRHSWVYNPDADEIPDDLFLEEMQAAAFDENLNSAYEVRFKNYLDGSWIRHSTDYPVWVIRFFRPKQLSFEREVNLRYVVDGQINRFEGHFNHFPFEKGLDWWISKHNQYSTKEAHEAIKIINKSSFSLAIKKFTNTQSAKDRRLALKEISFFLPYRGLMRFFYSYLFRLGFLDGRAGLKYSILISFYEFMISEKIREMKSILPPKHDLDC